MVAIGSRSGYSERLPAILRGATLARPPRDGRGDGAHGARRIEQRGLGDIVGVGKGGFLAADRAHAHALVDAERAGLDDAFLQAPAFAAGVLEIQVGVVDLVRPDLAPAPGSDADSSRPKGVSSRALAMARRSMVGSREIMAHFRLRALPASARRQSAPCRRRARSGGSAGPRQPLQQGGIVQVGQAAGAGLGKHVARAARPAARRSRRRCAACSASRVSFSSSVMWARGARSPAMARRMRSEPIQLWPLDCSITSSVRARSSPMRCGQCQHLGGAHQVDAGRQVVDQLGAGAVAGLLADAKHLGRQGLDQRRDGARTPSAGRPPSGSCCRRAPAPGRPTSARRCRCRPNGRSCSAIASTSPGASVGHSITRMAQVHGVGHARRRRTARRGVCTASTTQTMVSLRRPRRVGRQSRGPSRPERASAWLRSGRQIADMHRPAAIEQARGHRAAHVADADDGHRVGSAHGGSPLCAASRARPDAHDCTSRLDLPIDISMPSASPSVTMAVPP